MENQPAAPATENQNGPMLTVQTVYLKDCSYEAPKGPRIEGDVVHCIPRLIEVVERVLRRSLHEWQDANSPTVASVAGRRKRQVRVVVVRQGETNLPEVVLAIQFGRATDASPYSDYDAKGECDRQNRERAQQR